MHTSGHTGRGIGHHPKVRWSLAYNNVHDDKLLSALTTPFSYAQTLTEPKAKKKRKKKKLSVEICAIFKTGPSEGVSLPCPKPAPPALPARER